MSSQPVGISDRCFDSSIYIPRVLTMILIAKIQTRKFRKNVYWSYFVLGELPVLKDISIAKNYLNEEELKALNHLVSGYFDLIEFNAIEYKPMYMEDYVDQLDAILLSGNRKLLAGYGKVSHDQAVKRAKAEYINYQKNILSLMEQPYLETIKHFGENAKNCGLNEK